MASVQMIATRSQGNGKGITTVTINYTVSENATGVTVTAQSISQESQILGNPSRQDQMVIQEYLQMFSDGTFTLLFDNQTVASRTGASGAMAGSKTIAKGTTNKNTTITLKASSTTGVNVVYGANPITIVVLQSYTVSYNLNSGSGTIPNQTKYYDIPLTLSSTKTVKEGYTFRGWAASEANAKNGEVDYNPGSQYNGNAPLTLWAVWELTYHKPIINNLKIERCDSSGNLDDEGTCAYVHFDWAVFRSSEPRYYGGDIAPYDRNSGNGSIIVGFNPSQFSMPGYTGSYSIILSNNTYSPDIEYGFIVTVSDTQSIFGDNSTTVEGVLSSAHFPMDFNADASAMGIFMPAPNNDEGLFCGKQVHFRDKNDVMRALFDFCYPVGSYYYTSDPDFNPEDSWGGEWSLLGEGQVLLSGSASGEYIVGTQYGGNTKTIAASNLPAHKHSVNAINTEGMSGNETHRHSPPTTTNRFIVYNYGDVQTGVSERKVAAASSGNYMAPVVNNADTDWIGSQYTSYNSVAHTHRVPAHNTNDNTGGGSAFNVMQLSTATYIWHRTA